MKRIRSRCGQQWPRGPREGESPSERASERPAKAAAPREGASTRKGTNARPARAADLRPAYAFATTLSVDTILSEHRRLQRPWCFLLHKTPTGAPRCICTIPRGGNPYDVFL